MIAVISAAFGGFAYYAALWAGESRWFAACLALLAAAAMLAIAS